MRARLNWTNAFVFLLGLALLWTGYTSGSFAVCVLGSLFSGVAVAMAYFQQWARWTALSGVVALCLGAIIQIIVKGISLPLCVAIAVLGILAWDIWCELRRAARDKARPLIAFVQLRRIANNFLTDRKLAEVAEKVWGVKFSAGEDGEHRNFVVGRSPAFLVNGPDATLLVNNFAQCYFDDMAKALEGMKELRLKHAIANHNAWMSVDLLRFHDDSRKPAEAYPILGKFLAELVDDDCLAILCPETGNIVSHEPQVVERLRSDKPMQAFGDSPFVPVIAVNDNDPRMKAAVEEARRRWPEFVEAFNGRKGEFFAIKAPVTVDENTEFIWIELERVDGSVLHGKLANDPVDLGMLKCGDAVTVSFDDLNDWNYVCEGTIHGGFTAKALEEISKAAEEAKA